MTDDKNTASLKQEESFKEQLDKKAQKPESPQPNPIVEKSECLSSIRYQARGPFTRSTFK